MKNLIDTYRLSLKEFANKYEIPYNTVRQWYNGERTPPKYVKKFIEEIMELREKEKQLNFLKPLDELKEL